MAPLAKIVKTNQIHRPVQAFCDTFKHTAPLFKSFNSMDRSNFLQKGTLPPPSTNSSGRVRHSSFQNLTPIFDKFHWPPINSVAAEITPGWTIEWMENGTLEPNDFAGSGAGCSRLKLFDVSDFSS
jgi:hypothetical protein